MNKERDFKSNQVMMTQSNQQVCLQLATELLHSGDAMKGCKVMQELLYRLTEGSRGTEGKKPICNPFVLLPPSRI